jgi:hypothetical protein
MSNYSVELPNDLRKRLAVLAVDAGDGGKLKNTLLRALKIGTTVLEAGHATLDEFCAAQRNETLDNWTDEHDSD